MWCKKRHKVITAIFRPIFKLHFRIKYKDLWNEVDNLASPQKGRSL